MVTDMLVIRKATWFAVPKYNGTNANQITQVVYIVKPKKKNSLKIYVIRKNSKVFSMVSFKKQ